MTYSTHPANPAGDFNATPFSQTYRMLSAVMRDAQAKLNELGFDVGRPDGAGGPKTTNALRAFQKDRGIPVTGRLDNATKSELAK